MTVSQIWSHIMLYSLYYSYNGHLTYPHLKFWGMEDLWAHFIQHFRFFSFFDKSCMSHNKCTWSNIDKRNVSWKFHQNPTLGRHILKNSSYFEGLTGQLLRQNYEKDLPEVGFSWNFQETFLLSIVWSCPNFKSIASL